MKNTPETQRGTSPETHRSASPDRGTTRATRLAYLDKLDNYKIADGEPDIRGWDVKSTDGQKLGEVENLLVDTGLMKVRYIELKLEKKFASGDDRRWALVPIGAARLDDDDDVLIGVAGSDLSGMPPYERGKVSREYETALMQRYGRGDTAGGDFYGTDHFDENRAFAGRRAQAKPSGTGRDGYLVRSEEELAVGKRKVEAGSVNVHKTVETEHVRETVPVKREEVTVERRKVTGDGAARGGEVQIEKDEIRVPVMEEEVVARKQAVAKEEVVIRKDVVEDEKVVEADLKKERIDVDREGDPRQRRKDR